MVKVVLVTVGQPSTNPRLVKEADALSSAGYDVTVLYCHFIEWADKTDESLLKDVAWKFMMVGGSPSTRKLHFYLTRLRFKLAGKMNRLLGNRWGIAEKAHSRAYDELLTAAKNIESDWYIGHTLGTMPVVVKAAHFNNGKAGFDFEDYHRGESDSMQDHDRDRIVYLEDKYVPRLSYMSAASPLIAKKVSENYPHYAGKVVSISNCFSLKHQPPFRKKSDDINRLELFWFSQTIGENRGLEILIESLVELNDPSIHLTLAGKCKNEFKLYLDENAGNIRHQIHLAGIIAPEMLAHYAAKFDIGLALETGFSENNKLALSNKIFTYMLGGNALILSETPMQKSFNEVNKVGLSFGVGDKKGLIRCIKTFKDCIVLEQQRSHNYILSQKELNWEKESQKLLDLIQ